MLRAQAPRRRRLREMTGRGRCRSWGITLALKGLKLSSVSLLMRGSDADVSVELILKEKPRTNLKTLQPVVSGHKPTRK